MINKIRTGIILSCRDFFNKEIITISFRVLFGINAYKVAPSETKGYNSYTNRSYYDMFLCNFNFHFYQKL